MVLQERAGLAALGIDVGERIAVLQTFGLAMAPRDVATSIYAWVGAAYRASVHGATYPPSSNFTTMRVLNDNGSYGTAYAFCSPTGNDGTGVTSAAAGTAQATPYLTVAAAAAGIKTINNSTYSRNNTSGGIIRLEVGTFTHANFSASTSGEMPLVIEAANPANKATTIYQDPAAIITTTVPENLKFKDIKIKRQSSGNAVFFDCANLTTSRLFFENCTMDNSGFAAQTYQFYMYSVAFVSIINCDGDDLGFAIANDGKKQLNVIGSSHSLGAFTYNVAGCKSLECYLIDSGFGTGNRELSIGRFIGFSFLGGNGGEVVNHSATIGDRGLTLVGNVIEARGGPITPAVIIAALTQNGKNVVLQLNSIVGQRTLFGYNDGGLSDKAGSYRFNVCHVYACKGDVFSSNGAYVGNWPVMHHVGYRSNAYIQGDTQNNGFGAGQ